MYIQQEMYRGMGLLGSFTSLPVIFLLNISGIEFERATGQKGVNFWPKVAQIGKNGKNDISLAPQAPKILKNFGDQAHFCAMRRFYCIKIHSIA